LPSSTEAPPVLPSEEVKAEKAKKKHGEKTEPEAESDFKKGKKKTKYHAPESDDDDRNMQVRHKRGKVKKRRGNEKSEKYREAEEALTHGFAMPTTPVVRDVAIPETITVAELAKRMSV